MPRFWLHRVMTLPTNSSGTKIVAVMMGSRISSIFDSSGSLNGFSTLISVPSFITTSYTTVGAVVMRSMSYSRSSRSCTMSMCSRPRKPQRKPKPSACETSGSNCSAASFSCSLVSASRSASKSCDSTGYRPANTCDCTFLKPGSGSLAGRSIRVMVSPTCADLSSLMPAITKPTSPADKLRRGRPTSG